MRGLALLDFQNPWVGLVLFLHLGNLKMVRPEDPWDELKDHMKVLLEGVQFEVVWAK